jgi:hypothetical protein
VFLQDALAGAGKGFRPSLPVIGSSSLYGSAGDQPAKSHGEGHQDHRELCSSSRSRTLALRSGLQHARMMGARLPHALRRRGNRQAISPTEPVGVQVTGPSRQAQRAPRSSLIGRRAHRLRLVEDPARTRLELGRARRVGQEDRRRGWSPLRGRACGKKKKKKPKRSAAIGPHRPSAALGPTLAGLGQFRRRRLKASQSAHSAPGRCAPAAPEGRCRVGPAALPRRAG